MLGSSTRCAHHAQACCSIELRTLECIPLQGTGSNFQVHLQQCLMKTGRLVVLPGMVICLG